MKNKIAYHWFIGLVFGLALAVGAYFRQSAQAHEGQTVDLIYFLAESDPEGVRLEWRTASEYDIAGFRVKRATQPDGPYETIDVVWNGQTVNIIPAMATFPETGELYEVWDVAAAGGQTYWYKLAVLEFSGIEVLFGPVSSVGGYSPRIYLPLLLTSY